MKDKNSERITIATSTNTITRVKIIHTFKSTVSGFLFQAKAQSKFYSQSNSKISQLFPNNILEQFMLPCLLPAALAAFPPYLFNTDIHSCRSTES